MIKRRDYRVIETLEKIAADVLPIKSARIASAVVIDGNIISIGTNQNRTDPFQKRFARNDKCGALLHSEVDSIKKALKRVSFNDLSRATVYVCRTKYSAPREDGGKMQWGLAKPCAGCERLLLQWAEVARIVYTTDEGTLEEM